MTEFKIGILLPRSSLYPAIAFDVMHGIKAGLKHHALGQIKLVYENIGFGGDQDEVYAKTEKLVLQEEVDVVIGFMDYMRAVALDSLCAQSNTLLIVLDPGGHIPTDWTTSSYRYTISLQAALGSRLAGALAAREGTENAMMATSFYEGGYLQCFAYSKGIENGGGHIRSHIVVPFRHEEFSIEPLKQVFEQTRPDAVLAQFSAEAGQLFLQEYAATGFHETARFYASPFMLEETWLLGIDYPFNGIRGYVSWFKDLNNKTNEAFKQTMLSAFNKSANIFSVVGWEAAQLLAVGWPMIEKHGGDIAASGDTLRHMQFDSPRGELRMHGATNHLFAPMYLVELVPDIDNKPALKLIREEPAMEDLFERFVEEKPRGIFSKWTNTYLCI